jgi:hypothetical protein
MLRDLPLSLQVFGDGTVSDIVEDNSVDASHAPFRLHLIVITLMFGWPWRSLSKT